MSLNCLPTVNKRPLSAFFLCAVFIIFPLLFAHAESNTITFSADSMSGTTKENSEYTLLKGNAAIKTNTMELNADSIELSGTEYRKIKALGSVKGVYSDGGFGFTCNSLRHDRETGITVLEGSVFMDDTENKVEAKAEYIEYNKKNETAFIQINTEIKQEDAVCTAAFAVYRKKQRILELNGAPKIVEGSNVFRAQEIVFNLDTKEIVLDGKVSGSVTDTKKTEKD
ncbi:LptA/OstA family protein [Treponema sp. HNW]|uniref:LptA/OstA family protein n=1 Tax=Treponema sp. HNW TaxID=3116654 RepID=UPI003D10BE01